ncbi:hypothetical protein N7510_001265 [Penicillium lagena]|uniref:uncharacterized protein n=1 Tax=Penicillium lagena TaxID=94218 RepID=UPI0025426043|nr:uncharacterized protein N7510_001265 [Penicillium lagena]KAJ5624956.1 hypothetical protein N7510_001265 [Penicillium lagena]
MAPLKITVTGTSSIFRHPERGILTINVSARGFAQEVVGKEATETFKELHQLFRDLSAKTEDGEVKPDAAVINFSAGHLRTWTRDTNEERGRQREHRADMNIQVVFRDFTKMSEVVSSLAWRPNVEISGINWRLTEDTEKALGSESRKEAIRDAINKARDYAEVAGVEVVPVDIQEKATHSMIATKRGRSMDGGLTSSLAGGATDYESQSLDLTPHQIQFTSAVVVEFMAK